MAKNEGKKFEEDFQKSVPDDWFCYRLKDSSGSWSKTDASRFTPTNICDFFVFTGENLYGVECKSFKGKSIPYSNIKDNQLNGLLGMSKKLPLGSHGCFILNFRDVEKTFMVPAESLEYVMNRSRRKSFSLEEAEMNGYLVPQKLKRVRYSYDIESVLS